jgi:hypothetical protein
MFKSKRITILWFILLVAFTSSGALAYAQESQAEMAEPLIVLQPSLSTNSEAISRYEDGEELIMSLIIDDYILGEIFMVFQSGQFYFHFGDFASAVDFPISKTFDDQRPSFSGFWAKPSNDFRLIFQTGDDGQIATVSSSNQSYILTNEHMLDIAGDVFFSEVALSKWFNAEFKYDLSKQRVFVNTSEPWPFQQEKNRQNANFYSRNGIEQAVEPHFNPGYQIISQQMLDLVGNIGQAGIGEENTRTNASYGVLGRNDLLNWSTRYYFGGNDDDLLASAYLDFSKHWSEIDALPFGITNIQFGDVQPVRIRGKSFNNVHGVSVSNRQLNVEINQEVTNISGYVQQGWDVELYHEGVLIAQLLNVQDGRYEFLDIIMFGGKNDFEIKKFGPQGQEQIEVIERFSQFITDELFDPSFEVSLVENNKSLLGVNETNNQSSYISLDGRYSMAISKGLNLNIEHSINLNEGENQLTGEGAQIEEGLQEFGVFGDTKQSNLFSLGLSARPLDQLSVTTNLLHVENQYNNLNFSAFTNILDQRLVLTGEVFSSLNDDNEGNTFKRLAISASGGIPTFGLFDLKHITQLFVRSDVFNRNSYSFENSLSSVIGGVAVSNSLFLTRTEQEDREFLDDVSGNLAVSTSLGNMFTRAGLRYDLTDGFEAQNAFANVNYPLSENLSMKAEISKSFQNDLRRYALSFDWRHDAYAINARLQHNSTQGSSVFLSGRISIGEAPTEFGYIQNRSSLTNTGPVLVRVFHDVNNNLIYDAEDIALKDVKVRAVQGNRTSSTDIIGIAQLDNLSNFRQTDIVIDKRSLENPFLMHSTQLTSLTSRPGLLTLVNYPLVEGAEIEGEVTFIDEFGEIQYVSNLQLVLRDQHGEIQHAFKTGFDGYFYVSGILPHKYTIDLAPSEKEGPFKLPKVVDVTINEQGQIISGLDFSVIPKSVVTGYYVHTGDFTNQEYIDIYYQMLKPQLDQLQMNITPFRHALENDKFALGISFVNAREEAELICAGLSNSLANCSIESHRYFLN